MADGDPKACEFVECQKKTPSLADHIEYTRNSVEVLDRQQQNANCFRKSSKKLVDAAYRALNNLKQASTISCTPDLITHACDIRAEAQHGTDLVRTFCHLNKFQRIFIGCQRATVQQQFNDVIAQLRLLAVFDVSRLPSLPCYNKTASSTSAPNCDGKECFSYLVDQPVPASNAIHLEHPKQANGHVVREGKRDRLKALLLVPADSSSELLFNVWWSVNETLEVYSEATQMITGFAIEKPSHKVTALAYDPKGNIWTGHPTGLLRVRRARNCKVIAEGSASKVVVQVIVFEPSGNAWIGDSKGLVHIVKMEEEQGAVRKVATLSYSQAMLDAMCQTVGSYKPAALLARVNMSLEGPVHAIYVRGSYGWVAGGRSPGWISLWNSSDYTGLDAFNCGSYGAAHVLTALDWAVPAQVEGPRSWKLLSGHESGQVLIWDADAATLTPLLIVGEIGSPVRGIHCFEQFNLVVTAYASGDLYVYMPPSPEITTLSSNMSTLKPKRMRVPAHRNAITLMSSFGDMCVTSSTNGTIRIWSVEELAKEAERQNIYMSLSIHRMDAVLRQSGSSNTFIHSNTELSRSSRGSIPKLRQTTSTPLAESCRPPELPLTHHKSLSQVNEHSSPAGSPKQACVSSSGLDSTPHGFQNTSCQCIEAHELKMVKMIGSGSYGEVWLAEWMGCHVAVKELKSVASSDTDQSSSQELGTLMKEVNLMGGLSHPNILRFIAVCFAPPMLVMQYHAHGSLFDLLKRVRRGEGRALADFTWSKRLDMLKDVAAGMRYLHSRKPPVVHGDLRSPNILLDYLIEKERPRFHMKIADFGLAKLLQGHNANGLSTFASKTTNPRWSAPEVITHGLVGKAADVYSFAIMMWEMLTWEQPYKDMMCVQVIFSTVMQHSRPDVPCDEQLPGNPGPSLAAYKELMCTCWSADACERPSFDAIVESIDSMQQTERSARYEAAASMQERRQGKAMQAQSSPSAGGLPASGSNGEPNASEAAAVVGAGARLAGNSCSGEQGRYAGGRLMERIEEESQDSGSVGRISHGPTTALQAVPSSAGPRPSHSAGLLSRGKSETEICPPRPATDSAHWTTSSPPLSCLPGLRHPSWNYPDSNCADHSFTSPGLKHKQTSARKMSSPCLPSFLHPGDGNLQLSDSQPKRRASAFTSSTVSGSGQPVCRDFREGYELACNLKRQAAYSTLHNMACVPTMINSKPGAPCCLDKSCVVDSPVDLPKSGESNVTPVRSHDLSDLHQAHYSPRNHSSLGGSMKIGESSSGGGESCVSNQGWADKVDDCRIESQKYIGPLSFDRTSCPVGCVNTHTCMTDVSESSMGQPSREPNGPLPVASQNKAIQHCQSVPSPICVLKPNFAGISEGTHLDGRALLPSRGQVNVLNEPKNSHNIELLPNVERALPQAQRGSNRSGHAAIHILPRIKRLKVACSAPAPSCSPLLHISTSAPTVTGSALSAGSSVHAALGQVNSQWRSRTTLPTTYMPPGHLLQCRGSPNSPLSPRSSHVPSPNSARQSRAPDLLQSAQGLESELWPRPLMPHSASDQELLRMVPDSASSGYLTEASTLRDGRHAADELSSTSFHKAFQASAGSNVVDASFYQSMSRSLDIYPDIPPCSSVFSPYINVPPSTRLHSTHAV